MTREDITKGDIHPYNSQIHPFLPWKAAIDLIGEVFGRMLS